MKKNLPNDNKFQTVPTTIALRRKYFPSINRVITEHVIFRHIKLFSKIVVVSFFSSFLLLQIIRQSSILRLKIDEVKTLKNERIQIEKEITYIKSLAPQYKGYRDIYYRAALLEYNIGNFGESKKYVDKVLEIDPNFADGRVLGEKIGF